MLPSVTKKYVCIVSKLHNINLTINQQNRFMQKGTCKCSHGGNITEFNVDSQLWCCKQTKENCNKYEIGSTDIVECLGKTMKLSQQCHVPFGSNSSACNYYQYDENRNVNYNFLGRVRSYVDICNDSM